MSKLKKILIGLGAFIVIVFVLAMVATQGVADVARAQLKALKDGDMIKAYSYTSKDFRNATSLDNFEKFINSYPSLKNNKDSTFSDREVNNDVGTLKGTLKSTDGGSTPVEYKMVKETGEWKILSIKVNPSGAGINQGEKTTISEGPQPTVQPPSTTTSTKKGTIFDIKLNTKTNSQGMVENHEDVYSPETPKILTSVYIKDTEKGNTVTAEMTYLPSNEKVGPVTNDVSEDGDSISNFSFSKPTKGWPLGEYIVSITLLNGEKKEVSFNVR